MFFLKLTRWLTGSLTLSVLFVFFVCHPVNKKEIDNHYDEDHETFSALKGMSRKSLGITNLTKQRGYERLESAKTY